MPLSLSRKTGEGLSLTISREQLTHMLKTARGATIHLAHIVNNGQRRNKICLGIDAPPEVRVLRDEVEPDPPTLAVA